MTIDFGKYESQLNINIDEAIDAVADNILEDMGIPDHNNDENYPKYLEVYTEIQKHLVEKWNKKFDQAEINKEAKAELKEFCKTLENKTEITAEDAETVEKIIEKMDDFTRKSSMGELTEYLVKKYKAKELTEEEYRNHWIYRLIKKMAATREVEEWD